MRIGIIGSRNIIIEDLKEYLTDNVTEIVSGGAKGVDQCAREYAIAENIKLTEFLPDYRRYGRYAPLERNIKIINYADRIIAFWDGKSKGTKHIIDNCEKMNKKIEVIIIT
ncbi:MAG: DUF2493 domain-containing protein [Clostridia bacterium]|nr:DUF2493 domain-containing protein [Clostridia bacterium]